MKAAIFSEHGGSDVLHLVDMSPPEPGPGEVQVRVRAASLNHLDLWTRRGLPIEITMPHIGGSDIAGEVSAVGPGAESVPMGTRVVADPALGYEWYDAEFSHGALARPPFRLIGEHTQGGFAEYAVVPASTLLEIPDGVSYETAAAAGLVFVTAWHALTNRARLQPGERVLITGGSGGVSTAAIQIARHMGATVFAVTSGPDNVARVGGLGAHVVYDRLEADFGKEVWKDTDKRGVDVVLDSVGQPVWADCLRTLTTYGRLVTYGRTAGNAGPVNIPLVFWKQLSILGSTMGTPAEFRRVMGLVFDGTYEPVIHEVMPLADIRRAHDMLEAGDVFGKLVLTP
jgi:NADPH:quinone reductase-like Zn-dependent oxidoreductase